MVHIAIGPPSVDDVVDLLRPGDICTHSFTGLSMKLVDDRGRLRKAARSALERGVLLDIGHGTGSFSFASAEALLAAGVRPDTISTDMHQQSVYGPMFDLPTTMTKFLALGNVARRRCPGRDVQTGRDPRSQRRGSARCARARAQTSRCSGCWMASSRSTTSTATCASASVLLRNTLTLLNGRELVRREPEPRAFWTQPTWPPGQVVFTERLQRLHDLGHTPDAMAAAVERGIQDRRPAVRHLPTGPPRRA